jgi:hypothetical protein
LKDIPQSVTLVERNKPIVKGLAKLHRDKDRFRVLEADIFKVTPAQIGLFHTVFLDPPWYSLHSSQFMWLASQCVELGGIVVSSLPPLNTRPNIEKERLACFEFWLQQGLFMENLFAERLEYAMPFFEFNALRAGGIPNIHPFWRKGDLVHLCKVKESSTTRPVFEQNSDKWEERELGSMRIRVKVSKRTFGDGSLSINHLVKGDILPTVSSRDERRSSANIWTSGNRIFKVNSPESFLQLIDGMGSERNNESRPDTKDTLDFLALVRDLEKREYNDYLDWLYHEMEGQVNQ